MLFANGSSTERDSNAQQYKSTMDHVARKFRSTSEGSSKCDANYHSYRTQHSHHTRNRIAFAHMPPHLDGMDVELQILGYAAHRTQRRHKHARRRDGVCSEEPRQCAVNGTRVRRAVRRCVCVHGTEQHAEQLLTDTTAVLQYQCLDGTCVQPVTACSHIVLLPALMPFCRVQMWFLVATSPFHTSCDAADTKPCGKTIGIDTSHEERETIKEDQHAA